MPWIARRAGADRSLILRPATDIAHRHPAWSGAVPVSFRAPGVRERVRFCEDACFRDPCDLSRMATAMFAPSQDVLAGAASNHVLGVLTQCGTDPVALAGQVMQAPRPHPGTNR